jgi:hypothetical protein
VRAQRIPSRVDVAGNVYRVGGDGG